MITTVAAKRDNCCRPGNWLKGSVEQCIIQFDRGNCNRATFLTATVGMNKSCSLNHFVLSRVFPDFMNSGKRDRGGFFVRDGSTRAVDRDTTHP